MPGFNPVGSIPVAALGGAGTIISPAAAVITLVGEQGYVNAGIRISKVNLAIESHPASAVVFSKTNMAVESHPTPGTFISKTNFAVEATGIISSSRGSISILW